MISLVPGLLQASLPLSRKSKQRLPGSCPEGMTHGQCGRSGVYSSFLVSAAREAGVGVHQLMKLPMFSHGLKKDECPGELTSVSALPVYLPEDDSLLFSSENV